MEARPLGLLEVIQDRLSPWWPLEWVNSLYRVLPWRLYGKDSPHGLSLGEPPERWRLAYWGCS